METINVKPWGKDQGDFVVINKADFDPKVHQLLDAPDEDPEGAKKATVAELREALTAKGIEIPEGAKKADLQALLDAANKPADPA
jgi:hypothetical protein